MIKGSPRGKRQEILDMVFKIYLKCEGTRSNPILWGEPEKYMR